MKMSTGSLVAYTYMLSSVAIPIHAREEGIMVPIGKCYQPAKRQLVPIHKQLVCPSTSENPRHDHQTIFPLEDGRLMMIWSEYYSTDTSDQSQCQISAKLSDDKGRTWSARQVLQKNLWKRNVKQSNLIRMPSGEILFFYVGWTSHLQRNVFMKRFQNDTDLLGQLTDGGDNLAKGIQISKPGNYCNNADRVLMLSTGRILLPAHWGIGGKPEGNGTKLESFVYYSDDGFQTWRKSGTMRAPGRGAHEPTVVELKDGRLLCFMRTDRARVYQAVSEDQGVTWSKPAPSVLHAPESPPLLKRIPQTGDLLAMWNNEQVEPPAHHGYGHLTAAISQNDGLTWTNPHDIVVPPDSGAYMSAYFQDDEVIIMSSTRGGNREITERILKVSEFYVTQ